MNAFGDSCPLFAPDRWKDKDIDFSKFSPPFKSTLLASHMSSSSASVICYSISKSHSLLLLSSLHPVSTTTSHHHPSSETPSSPYITSPSLSPLSSLQEREASRLSHGESFSSFAPSTSIQQSEEKEKEDKTGGRCPEVASEENVFTSKRRRERLFQLWLMAELTQLAMSFVSTFSITELSNTCSAVGRFCEVLQDHLKQKSHLTKEMNDSHFNRVILSSSFSSPSESVNLSDSHREAPSPQQKKTCIENDMSTGDVHRTPERGDEDHVDAERKERRNKEEEESRGEREDEISVNGEKRDRLERHTSPVLLKEKKEKQKKDEGENVRGRNAFSRMAEIDGQDQVRKDELLSRADRTHKEEDQDAIAKRRESLGSIEEAEEELEK